MSGLSESKQTHVHLRNVDAATLQIIIAYAYTGNLAINDSTVEQLYETACFLQVSGFSSVIYINWFILSRNIVSSVMSSIDVIFLLQILEGKFSLFIFIYLKKNFF